jgi:catalase
VAGYFQPSVDAGQLSTAIHFNTARTPVLARFSNSTGIPVIRDDDPSSNPKGLAVRFILGERKHTDIISHSTPFFPTRTGEDFLKFLAAIRDGSIENFLQQHAAAKAFETVQYYGINAFKMVNTHGQAAFIRYTFVPLQTEVVDDDLKRPDDFLFKALAGTLADGEIVFRLVAQVAQDGDITDDATISWGTDRQMVELGTVVFTEVVGDSEREEKIIIFDPIPRVEGIEPSMDPLLQTRADAYLISGRCRREA